ncbi:MAG TPA: hypothetical protein VIC82_08285 [Candidatus Nanopelagicales bacterium]
MVGPVLLVALFTYVTARRALLARRIARQPKFVSWVRSESPQPADVVKSDVNDCDLRWTSLDDRQLERLLSESS